MTNLDSVIGLGMHAGPGRWNDPDMLEVIFSSSTVWSKESKSRTFTQRLDAPYTLLH